MFKQWPIAQKELKVLSLWAKDIHKNNLGNFKDKIKSKENPGFREHLPFCSAYHM